MAPRISIITVCFNAEDGIVSTLRSVANLKFRDFEYIVVDGGSRDKTLALIHEHGGHVTKLVSEPDRGIYDAMNKGIALATGDFLWFLNAKDTIYDGSFLEALDWKSDFYYGGVVLRQGDRELKRLMPRSALGPLISLLGQVACHQSMLVRRTLAPDYDLRYRLVSDFDWTIRILRTPGIRSQRVDCYWVNYELDGLSTRNALKCWKENLAIISERYGYWALPLTYLRFGVFVLKGRVKRLVSRLEQKGHSIEAGSRQNT